MEAVFHDITLSERLACQNVVSSRAKFHYSELAERFDEFTGTVVALGGKPKGPLFYSLNNVPLDETVDVEMFLPIQQDSLVGQQGLRFHSYFEVSLMLRAVVQGDFESQTELVYARLLATLDANDLEMNSPFFHVLQKDISPFALAYVGYVDPGSAD